MADPAELHPVKSHQRIPMVKRPEAGLAAAILVAVAMSVLLIQAAEKWSLASGSRLAGVTLWLLGFGCLAVISVILGRMMNVTVTGAGGVTVLGISLGAVLGSLKVSDVVAAPLLVTISFVVMAAAAGFQASPRSQRLVAITFWLLGAGMLAGVTWTCVFGE